jgi:arsenate reductase
MGERTVNVLFLCTHNSARSVLAEALLNHLGKGRFRGFSAGSHPRSEVNPLSLQVLTEAGIATTGLHSKSWDEFGRPDAPRMDLVITVCDNAAGEVCPYWPGQPATAHWGYADPSAVKGSDEQRLAAFRQTMFQMRRRLELLINLPPPSLERMALLDAARRLAAS